MRYIELEKLGCKSMQDLANYLQCWIAKDRNGQIYLYSEKPNKNIAYWGNNLNNITADLFIIPQSYLDLPWEDSLIEPEQEIDWETLPKGTKITDGTEEEIFIAYYKDFIYFRNGVESIDLNKSWKIVKE